MRICSIGECMVELNPAKNNNYNLTFAGDTGNTAVYLSRLGAKTYYMTSIGTDKLSKKMEAFLQKENINNKFIFKNPKKNIGLYLIENNKFGERHFYYWRSDSAAKYLFDKIEINNFAKLFNDINVIYLSGITLSIYNDKNLKKFYNFLKLLRKKNITICIDINARLTNWKSREFAVRVLKKFTKIANMVFFTHEDLKLLKIKNVNLFIKNNTNKKSIKVFRKGNGEVIFFDSNKRETFRLNLNKKVVDTTGCGDAFNASFIFNYFKNNSIKKSISLSHKLAKKVAYNKGALIPKKFFIRKDYTN
ncbi:MAG: 2-dehydro-3-deoxygluconokinase [Alphaproteobacteria bacterium MarineAlpha5_Bin6]|nr:MAG: 2-dehydro-3-deoxygluconokinase [Alphaproteobacteria bacterium MarineAlpha5_Bin6]